MDESNRAFQEMFQAAKDMLHGRDPEQVAALAGVRFDGGGFLVPSLGQTLRFSYPDYRCETPLHAWQYLTILHYLHLADGSPVTGQPIPLGDMPGGLVRGSKYDRSVVQALAAFLNGKTEARLRTVFQSLGGVFRAGKGDLNVTLPYLPRFPLYLSVWFADEEFPASGTLLLDRCAPHYLTVEDAVSLGDVVLERLTLAESQKERA